jgi:SPP1 family predicted phage head-tail adaptor
MKSAGRRNQLVTIEKLTEVSDGQGGQEPGYEELAREWSLIEPLSGTEAQIASQMSSVLTTGVTMPFREDISVKDRLTTGTVTDITDTVTDRRSLGTRFLEIESVQDPTGRREELRLLCSEVLK